MIDRSIVLFKIIISLIKQIKDEILKITDLETFKNFIKDYFSNFTDKPYIIYVLVLRKFEFNLDVIEKNRNNLFNIIKEKIDNSNKLKIERKKEKLKLQKKEKEKEKEKKTGNDNENENELETCDPIWQNCIEDMETPYEIKEFFIYKIQESPLISKNHFDENMIKFNKIIKSMSYNSSCSFDTQSTKSKSIKENNDIKDNQSINTFQSNLNINMSDEKEKSSLKSSNLSNDIKKNGEMIFKTKMINFTNALNGNMKFDKLERSSNSFGFGSGLGDRKLFKEKIYKQKSYDNSNLTYENLLIERRVHICYKNKNNLNNNRNSNNNSSNNSNNNSGYNKNKNKILKKNNNFPRRSICFLPNFSEFKELNEEKCYIENKESKEITKLFVNDFENKEKEIKTSREMRLEYRNKSKDLNLNFTFYNFMN
jgi:hypothetical protein